MMARQKQQEADVWDLVNQLIQNPETAKDGAILWLMLELAEAHKRIDMVRAAIGGAPKRRRP